MMSKSTWRGAVPATCLGVLLAFSEPTIGQLTIGGSVRFDGTGGPTLVVRGPGTYAGEFGNPEPREVDGFLRYTEGRLTVGASTSPLTIISKSTNKAERGGVLASVSEYEANVTVAVSTTTPVTYSLSLTDNSVIGSAGTVSVCLGGVNIQCYTRTNVGDVFDLLPRQGTLPAGGAVIQVITHVTDLSIAGFDIPDAGADVTVSLQLGPADTSDLIRWVNPDGGSYDAISNWSPQQVPEHSTKRSDTAVFDLPSVLAIPVLGNLATAGQWRVTNSLIAFSGDAHLLATDRDSLRITAGVGAGELHLVSPSVLTTEGCVLGDPGSGEALLRIVGGGSDWISDGPVQVGHVSPGRIEVANGSADTVEVRLGGFSGATGTAEVSGVDGFWTATDFFVGNSTARGVLSLTDGGGLRSQGMAMVDGPSGQAGLATISGVGGSTVNSVWEHAGTLIVGDQRLGVVRISNGGLVDATEVKIGNLDGSSGDVQVAGVHANLEKSILHTGSLRVGHNEGTGRLEVLDGAGVTGDLADIGCNGNGQVVVRGSSNPSDLSDLSQFAAIDLQENLVVGCGLNGGEGVLTVGSGGVVQVGNLIVTGSGDGGTGQVFVNGEGGRARVFATDAISVDAMNIIEVVADGGGEIKAQTLTIGRNAVRPGAADLNLSGANSADPPVPTLLHVRSDAVDGSPAGLAIVGGTAPGQLKVEHGAAAQFDGGLHVGQGAQGIVIVSNLNTPQGQSTLTVTGEARVGVGAFGSVQLGDLAQMVCNGDLKIGVGPGSPSGSVSVIATSSLAVTGSLSLGETGDGRLRVENNSDVTVTGALSVGVGHVGTLDVLSESDVSCDTLAVGGNGPATTGVVNVSSSFLNVRQSAQIGSELGTGTLTLQDSSAKLILSETMNLGSPNGGSSTGTVALVNGARIEGSGSITVNPNGKLLGSGTVALCSACTVRAGGEVSPTIAFTPQAAVTAMETSNGRERVTAGFSPGQLTIEGNYEQLPTGLLILNHFGPGPGESDTLHVFGQVTLGGRLEIHFVGGFSPSDPEAFIQSQDFIEADGGMLGDYDERVFVYPDLFADFDDDGDKDLHDVASFANCMTESGNLSEVCERADWERDGAIGGREIHELAFRLDGPE